MDALIDSIDWLDILVSASLATAFGFTLELWLERRRRQRQQAELAQRAWLRHRR